MYNVKPGDGGQAMAGLLCGRLFALNGQTLSGLFVFAWQEPSRVGFARRDRAGPGRTGPAQAGGGGVLLAKASCGPAGRGTCRGAWQRDRAARWITGVLGMWRS
jgi:hypothetical protein